MFITTVSEFPPSSKILKRASALSIGVPRHNPRHLYVEQKFQKQSHTKVRLRLLGTTFHPCPITKSIGTPFAMLFLSTRTLPQSFPPKACSLKLSLKSSKGQFRFSADCFKEQFLMGKVLNQRKHGSVPGKSWSNGKCGQAPCLRVFLWATAGGRNPSIIFPQC